MTTDELQRQIEHLNEQNQKKIQEYEERFKAYQAQIQSEADQFQPMRDKCETQRQQIQQLLKYKNDLEVLLEQSTHSLEQKNRKMLLSEKSARGKEVQLDQAE